MNNIEKNLKVALANNEVSYDTYDDVNGKTYYFKAPAKVYDKPYNSETFISLWFPTENDKDIPYALAMASAHCTNGEYLPYCWFDVRLSRKVVESLMTLVPNDN